MKVLLKQDVDNLGFAGEVYDVAAGYGRNYLIPQGLAVKATNKEMKQASVWRKQAEIHRAELRAEYEILSTRIKETELTFTAKAGDTGKLYGSVTTAQIADKLNEVLGTEIDRRKIGAEPLRQLGKHKVVVRLSAEYHPEFTVHIKPEGEWEEVVSVELEVSEELDETEESVETPEDTDWNEEWPEFSTEDN